MRALVFVAAVAVVVGCSSSDDSKPSAGTDTIFGQAGSGAAGHGGSAGAAGQGGQAGDGGAAGQSHGGAAGHSAGAGGEPNKDAGTEDSGKAGEAGSTQDDGGSGPPDVIEVVDTCPLATQILGIKTLVSNGDSPADFATAYDQEVAAMSGPGPLLLEFRGLDQETPSAWELRLGAPDLAAGGTSFGETPATVSYHLGELRALYVEEVDVSFNLRFPTTSGHIDVPVVRVALGGSFNETCDEFFVEGLRLLIPDTAADLPFGGSTLGQLLGEPTGDYGEGKSNAWWIGVWGTVQAQ